MKEHVSHTVFGQRDERSSIPSADLPSEWSLVHVLGVDYVHTVTDDGGDLYLTPHGLPFARQLSPQSWFESSWFHAHRERLDGSASIYSVPTNPVAGQSIVLVVKYSRVGERVPLDTAVVENLVSCEFNGPFEEFSLVEDLRTNRRGQSDLRIKTQPPLAIYVRPERNQPSQLQRFQWRIARKTALHPGVTIDIMREYVMVFGWLPGIDAWAAHKLGLLSEADARGLGRQAEAAMETKGFHMLDMKPEHVIVQMSGPDEILSRNGVIEYGIVDYELLERTADYHQEIRTLRRTTYERRRRQSGQLRGKHSAGGTSSGSWPAGRHPVTIHGVDYVHGRTESTGGMLWVVGCDPELFDYCLPERWRTAVQRRFIKTHDTIYFTTSKDNVDFAWRVSRVGERPEMAAFGSHGFRAFAFGFNSPFEEVSLACRLRRCGLTVIAPLAIYRTRKLPDLAGSLSDLSRYRSHSHIVACDGSPILETQCRYMTIWDPWRGPGASLEDSTPNVLTIHAAQAAQKNLLSDQEVASLVEGTRQQLEALGVVVVRLMPTDVLVAVNMNEEVVRDNTGAPEACLCSFQHLNWAVE